MADTKPCKEDIQAVFKKLRAIPTNKTCFDCDAKNPTWASVTYGVFICIDCSAVHRGLGVHLTFVRSTQLDTNWSWIQLRQMQLGGNAAASVFFRQHNCVTTDAQQKYTSRAAQLYKDKLAQAANASMRLHGTQLHIDHPGVEKHEETRKDVDFFEEHSSFTSLVDNNNGATSQQPAIEPQSESVRQPVAPVAASLSASVKGPSVDMSAAHLPSTERKSIIGGRKPPAKKTGLGVKKGGLGAQRVQANFADLERQAEMSDQRKEKLAMEVKDAPEEEEKQLLSMRLAYQDLSMEQNKEEERIKRSDPKKAQQVERLGMGFSAKSGFSHSALGDMQTIEQEQPIKSSLGKSTYDSESGDDYLDDFIAPSFGMFRSVLTNSDKLGDYLETSSGSSRDRFTPKEEKITDIPSSKSWHESSPRDYKSRPPSNIFAAPTDDAQKKFGNAKAISSDQYFGQSSDSGHEVKANLSRFEGSTSISSSDYFGDGRSAPNSKTYYSGMSQSISAPDLDDVKESVRQGVTKVAGKISSLANGVLTSIQDRYGY